MEPVLEELENERAREVIVRKVDIDKEPDVLQSYRFVSAGTTIVLTPDGKEHCRKTEYLSAEDILAIIGEMAKANESADTRK